MPWCSGVVAEAWWRLDKSGLSFYQVFGVTESVRWSGEACNGRNERGNVEGKVHLVELTVRSARDRGMS